MCCRSKSFKENYLSENLEALNPPPKKDPKTPWEPRGGKLCMPSSDQGTEHLRGKQRWDWYFYVHELVDFYVKCREIYHITIHGLFGL